MQEIQAMVAGNAADWSVRRYKDELALYKSVARVAIAAAITLFTICLALGVRYALVEAEYADAAKKIESLTTQLETTKNASEQLQEKYDVLVEASENFQSVIDELDSENAKVVKANKKLNKQLSKLEAREELFDKYEYALYDKMGGRTDLTYDQVATGEEIMEEYGMDPDLLFGIIMTESGGDETATNSESTARGYGQLLSGTGEMVWENILGNGNYSHSYALDGDKNITMMAALLDWFRTDQNMTLTASIKYYRGVDDVSSYIATINSYIKTKGNSVEKIAANW
jgi:soluble lytic murein transglycosylase-like protein